MNSSSDSQAQVARVAKHNQEAVDKNTSRRRFLQGAAGAAGGLALGLQVVAHAEGTEPAQVVASTEVVLPLPEKVLSAVGNAEVIEADNDKIIVARTGETSVAACSAVCTHKGCIVGYEHETQEFVCPCHGARFGLDGKVKQGPARKPLKSYNARLAIGLSPKL